MEITLPKRILLSPTRFPLLLRYDMSDSNKELKREREIRREVQGKGATLT